VCAVHQAREARRDADVLRVADDILPHVREMRPAYPWETVARSLDRAGARARPAAAGPARPWGVRCAGWSATASWTRAFWSQAR
jgi:hypothetical protein